MLGVGCVVATNAVIFAAMHMLLELNQSSLWAKLCVCARLTGLHRLVHSTPTAALSRLCAPVPLVAELPLPTHILDLHI